MTFAKISKPWQLSSKLSSTAVSLAFPNKLEQLERKERPLKKIAQVFGKP